MIGGRVAVFSKLNLERLYTPALIFTQIRAVSISSFGSRQTVSHSSIGILLVATFVSWDLHDD